jgi:hypothetical protein
MSMDATVLKELERQSEEFNQTHVLGRAPRFGDQPVKLTGVWAELPKFITSAFEIYTEKKIKLLLKRIEELEARGPELRYCGVWSAGTTYKRNSLCTHQGSLWIATQTTASFPGGQAEPGAWVLCCKRGRDGKDAKGAA